VAMPGQADTEPASRAGSIAAGSKIGQQAQVSAAGQPTPEADVAAAQLVSAAPAEPAAAKAKQANGGLAVQRQQASIDELTASAPAVGDKSAMAGSPADAQSRASSATAGASAAADAAPSGHGCQIRVNQIYAGFIAVFICRQYFAVACSLFCPVHMPANHNLLCLGNMHRLIIPKPVSNRVLRAVTQVKTRAFQEKGLRIP